MAAGCFGILVGAASEAKHYLRKGRNNQLADAMILSGVRDERLIKQIAAWPEGADKFIQFIQERRLGPFAYARSYWKGQQATALFAGASGRIFRIAASCRL